MIPKEPRHALAQHSAFVKTEMRENQKQTLVQEARRGQRPWYTRRLNSLLCELDNQRVVLAERLGRFRLAQAILRGAETTLFSAGRCG